MNIINNLILQRKKRKYTMEQMAELTGIPFSTYRAIEKGERTANSDNMEKISKALRVKPNAIFLPHRYTIRVHQIEEAE